MEPKYTLEEPPKEEFEALTKELTAILTKYNCEIGVKSSIEILKRVEAKEEGIPTPYNGDNTDTTEETPKAN